ncbi:hypothetical protein SNE40_020528 [Patella caerulea]|uniref:Uncharacterized protein n=1 Tax=Patella caerulea TaxID=87958 RepID=A0AAN8GB39_PATCE
MDTRASGMVGAVLLLVLVQIHSGFSVQDICREYPYPESEADFFACKIFGPRSLEQQVELDCPGKTILIGKLEIGYRDRLCKDVINYMGCCFGEKIPKNSSIVCLSQSDITGTTNRLIQLRRNIIKDCKNRPSCRVVLDLKPLTEPSLADVYSVFVEVQYDCIGGPHKPKDHSVSIAGWIIAGIVSLLLVVTIVMLVIVYKKRKTTSAKKCLPAVSIRPLPCVPVNGTYSSLEDRGRSYVDNDYEKLKLEHTDYHEYLEPVTVPDVIGQHSVKKNEKC